MQVRYWPIFVALPFLVSSVPAPVDVVVNDAISYQTVEGFGAAEAYYLGAGSLPFDSVKKKQLFDLAFRSSGSRFLRLRVPHDMEFFNDDNDPYSLDASAFNNPNDPRWNRFNVHALDDSAEIAREARARGADFAWATCWSPPEWMKEGADPHQGLKGGHVKPGEPWASEFAEFLAAYVGLMKVKFGIEIKALSLFNEPGIGLDESTDTSPSQYAELLFRVGQRFQELGLNVALMGPETSNISHWQFGAVGAGYAKKLLGYPGIGPFLAALTTHQYGAPCDCQSSDWASLKNLAGSRPLLQTEMSKLSFGNDGIAGAVELANWIHVAMDAGNVVAWHHWSYWWPPQTAPIGSQEFQCPGLLISAPSGFTIPKRYYAFQQFAAHMLPGSLRVKTTAGPALKALTAMRPVGDRREAAVVMINSSTTADQVANLRFPTAPTGPISVYTTNTANSHKYELIAQPVDGALLLVNVPKNSVVTAEVPLGLTLSQGVEVIGSPTVLGPGDTFRLQLNYQFGSYPGSGPFGVYLVLVGEEAPQIALFSDGSNWLSQPALHKILDASQDFSETPALDVSTLPSGRYLIAGALVDLADGALVGGFNWTTLRKE